MESKELVYSVACLLIILSECRVGGMSTVNTDFERYLRAINSSTIVPTVEERVIIDSYTLAFLNYTYTNSAGEVERFSEEKGRYGEGKQLEVKGPLVHVSSRHNPQDDRACKADILGTKGNPFPSEPWIALVRRGECTFEEKVKHVAKEGAIGVIIYNDKPVVNLEKMQIKDKNPADARFKGGFLNLRRSWFPRWRCGRCRRIRWGAGNITAVMTYQEIGRDMAYIVDQGFEVTASISPGRRGVRPISTINKTSVLFVSISFIVLMIISLVWLIFYYIQRLRYFHSKDQQSRHLCSVTKRAIMKIPTKTGKSNEKDSDNDCCAICIEAYKSSDCIRVLPCKHEFHKNCIDPWLIEHRTCPMCKLDVLKYYGYVVGEQQTSASIPSTNERIINANDHIIITPSSNTSSSSSSSNRSSNIANGSGSDQINVVVINCPLASAPMATVSTSASDTTALNSDSRLNASNSSDSSANSSCSSSNGLTVITTTASRQVTDV